MSNQMAQLLERMDQQDVIIDDLRRDLVKEERKSDNLRHDLDKEEKKSDNLRRDLDKEERKSDDLRRDLEKEKADHRDDIDALREVSVRSPHI
jgi:hypothetical protein